MPPEQQPLGRPVFLEARKKVLGPPAATLPCKKSLTPSKRTTGLPLISEAASLSSVGCSPAVACAAAAPAPVAALLLDQPATTLPSACAPSVVLSNHSSRLELPVVGSKPPGPVFPVMTGPITNIESVPRV